MITIEDQNKSDAFIERLTKVHGGVYDYSATHYSRLDGGILINCYNHGYFMQRASSHLAGRGCPSCALLLSSGCSIQRWLKISKDRTCTLYVLLCVSDNESFIKIGITINTVGKRIKNKIPYSITVLRAISLEGLEAWSMEKRLGLKYKNLKYKPEKIFPGMHECFTTEIFDFTNFKLL